MGLELNATDKVGKSDIINVLLVLVFSWDLLTIRKIQKHQPHPLNNLNLNAFFLFKAVLRLSRFSESF